MGKYSQHAQSVEEPVTALPLPCSLHISNQGRGVVPYIAYIREYHPPVLTCKYHTLPPSLHLIPLSLKRKKNRLDRRLTSLDLDHKQVIKA